MSRIIGRKKICLRSRQIACGRMEAGGPSRRRHPTNKVAAVPKPGRPCVFQEHPVDSALRIPMRGVELRNSKSKPREDRLVNAQFLVAGGGVRPAHLSCLFDLMLRTQVFEEYAEGFPVFETREKVFTMKGRLVLARGPVKLKNPNRTTSRSAQCPFESLQHHAIQVIRADRLRTGYRSAADQRGSLEWRDAEDSRKGIEPIATSSCSDSSA